LPGKGRDDAERTAVPACELLQGTLPGAILDRAHGGGAEVTTQRPARLEKEDVGAGEGLRQVLALEPAEEREAVEWQCISTREAMGVSLL
jgi:hypothetical protein